MQNGIVGFNVETFSVRNVPAQLATEIWPIQTLR